MNSAPTSTHEPEKNVGSAIGEPSIPPLDIEALVNLAKKQKGHQPALLSFTDTELFECAELVADDPVASLYGRVAPSNITAVGLCASATVSSINETAADDDASSVIHIVQRSGRAVTVLFSGDDVRWFGPTHRPQQGRVPDSCRRLLGLSTTPASDSMTAFVIVAWLEVVTRYALEDPTIDWESIVALHPARNLLREPITPSTLAAATCSLGTSLNWERFRCVIATVGGFPFGENATEIARWMDEGMFSRWAMELLPSRSDALDILESVIGPATFDRVWATLRLCD
jgi:hypothetical protein